MTLPPMAKAELARVRAETDQLAAELAAERGGEATVRFVAGGGAPFPSLPLPLSCAAAARRVISDCHFSVQLNHFIPV
jgi:hypothetical protein